MRVPVALIACVSTAASIRAEPVPSPAVLIWKPQAEDAPGAFVIPSLPETCP